MLRRTLLLLALASAISPAAFGQNETVVIRPEASDEVLVNPGMGITTFQRFNGQPLICLRCRRKSNDQTRRISAALVFPILPAYCRWFWKTSPAAITSAG